MAIWAIGDLHLSFGIKGKEMNVFGPEWEKHHEKVQAHWDANVKSNDLVLIPGDISWAMRLEEAAADLAWIDERPGTKYFIRGNHDYWCQSASKVRQALPPSIHLIWSDAARFQDIAICGTRLWDSPEYNFGPYIEMKKPIKEGKKTDEKEDDGKIFRRELMRLETSLKALDRSCRLKIAMVHYPPISADLQPSEASKMLEEAGINICVFGHLHSLRPNQKLFGSRNGIAYHLTSCDWLNFQLLNIEP
jgi:predicted phosphohydrolase